MQRYQHWLVGLKKICLSLTADHINNNENYNANVTEHERRKLATVLFGTFSEWRFRQLVVSPSKRSLTIHWNYFLFVKCTLDDKSILVLCLCNWTELFVNEMFLLCRRTVNWELILYFNTRFNFLQYTLWTKQIYNLDKMSFSCWFRHKTRWTNHAFHTFSFSELKVYFWLELIR